MRFIGVGVAMQPIWCKPPNIVVDGDCQDAGVGGWGVFHAGALSKESNVFYPGRRSLKITYDGSNATGFALQNGRFVAGHKYHCIVWFAGDGSARPWVSDDAYGGVHVGTNSTALQLSEFQWTATGTKLFVGSDQLAAGRFVRLSNIWIWEVL